MDFKTLKKSVKKHGLGYAKLLLNTIRDSRDEYPFNDGQTKDECIELINSVIRSCETDLQLKQWGIKK